MCLRPALHLPQLFEIPTQYVVRVPISQPTCKALSALGLQWYSVPAVSSMELTVAGVTYTAAPFNGEADTLLNASSTSQHVDGIHVCLLVTHLHQPKHAKCTLSANTVTVATGKPAFCIVRTVVAHTWDKH